MIVNVKSNNALSGFYVVFDGSTMNEKPGWYGISHLMEHLVCKSIDHLQDLYQQKNISWNAMTSNTEIIFYMKGLDRHINEHKREFLDLLLSYIPTQEDLDNEKKIVLEEYKMTFNSQMGTHYNNIQRKYFNYYNPIGLRSDIENFTLDDCKEYLELYYKKPSKIINISQSNDFNDDDIEFRVQPKNKPFEININENLYKITSEEDTKVPEGMIPLELLTEYKNKTSILNFSDVITEDFSYLIFIAEMLGSGLNSPLYKEVREKMGLVYSISCFVDKLNNTSCVFGIMTDTSNNKVEIVQNEIKNIFENKEKYLTQERFDIIKDSILTRLEESEILKHSSYRKYITSPEWRLETIINDVTLDDIIKVADKYLIWDNFYKSIDTTEFI